MHLSSCLAVAAAFVQSPLCMYSSLIIFAAFTIEMRYQVEIGLAGLEK